MAIEYRRKGKIIMSNPITIEPTEFIDVRSGCKTYVFRIWDDYDSCYDNTFESIPDDDLELLKMIVDNCNQPRFSEGAMEVMIAFVAEENLGITIGGTYYEWNKIRGILEELL